MAETSAPGSAAALYTLNAWLSPAYPVGAFAYSQGLETAIAEGAVTSAETVTRWLDDCLGHGAGRTDAIFLAQAWTLHGEENASALDELIALSRALQPSSERLLESEALGQAFADVSHAAWSVPHAPAPYPIAVGRAAAHHATPLAPTLLLFLQSITANLVSAAIRLVPLGQTDGQRVISSLFAACERIAHEAQSAPIEAIGTCSILADIASMRHETQTPRLFRT